MIAAICFGVSAVLFKRALMESELMKVYLSKWFWLGAFIGVFGWFSLIEELEKGELSRVKPLLTLSYLVIIPLGAFWLKEPIGKKELAGMVMILIGAVII